MLQFSYRLQLKQNNVVRRRPEKTCPKKTGWEKNRLKVLYKQIWNNKNRYNTGLILKMLQILFPATWLFI